MIRAQVLKHSQEQNRAREEGAKGLSGEERLPEERRKRVSMSGSWGREGQRRWPNEYFFPTAVGSTFWVPKGVMAIEVLQNNEISGGGKNGERKEVGSAIRWKRANRLSINIKEWERGVVVLRDIDPKIIGVGVKRRKRGSRKFRKG